LPLLLALFQRTRIYNGEQRYRSFSNPCFIIEVLSHYFRIWSVARSPLRLSSWSDSHLQGLKNRRLHNNLPGNTSLFETHERSANQNSSVCPQSH
jgi:hypothetical protein